MAYSRQGTHDLIFVTDGVTLFRLEWEGASVDTYEVRTNEEDDSQFGYMTWLRQPNVLLVKEISAGGGFVCLQVCDALTGEITGRRSGEIPSDDSYTNYNLDWGDIDYTSLMCIKYKEHPTDADEAAIEAVCGVTNRAPVRFFVLNDTLDKCLLYTDIELAHGHNLGSKAWITRRYVGTPIAVTLPDGSHYTDTLYSNEVWGVVGDGTVGGSVVFSYNLSRSGKIRLLNLKDQNMAGALTELAKFGGAVLFDDTEVIDYGEGAVTVTPRLNIVGRTLISEEARTWELDRSWLQFDWEPVYDHFFRVLNVKFAGGETKLSTIDPVLGDLSLLAVPPASSIEYKLVFDKHFAQLRGRGILAWHSLPRQIATITTKEQYTYDAGVHPRRNIRRFDKIRIRRTADIGEVYYMEFLVLSIDVSDYDRTIKIRCVSIGQGNGGEWIEDIFPSVPQEYQITEVSSVT